MSQQIDPASDCPCGSGMAYRDCCGRAHRVRRQQRVNIAIFGTLIVAAVGYGGYRMYEVEMANRESVQLPPGSYYSEEHKHWHDTEHNEITIPGKVWSPNWNRWLNITDSLVEEARRKVAMERVNNPNAGQEDSVGPVPPQSGVPQPPGVPPAGKIWSERHGHWHDASNPAGV